MYLICSIYFLWLMLYEYITDKKNPLLLALSCAILATLAATRYQIGADYNNYFEIFQELLQDPNSNPRLEIGWRYITYALSFLGFNVYGCFAFWGVVSMVLLYYGLKKHAPYPLMGCSIFFFCYSITALFSIMRQMVVFAIIIASLDVILKRQHVKAIIIFLIALSIHNSAILLVPIYILTIYDHVLGKHKYWILVIALLAGLGGHAITLLMESTNFMPSALARSIVIHVTSTTFNEQKLSTISIAKKFIVVLIILFYSKKIGEKWRHASVAIPLYFWSNVIALVLFSSPKISIRIFWFAKILEILILPSILLIIKDPTLKRCFLAILIIWCLSTLFYLLFVCETSLPPYPFRTIF